MQLFVDSKNPLNYDISSPCRPLGGFSLLKVSIFAVTGAAIYFSRQSFLRLLAMAVTAFFLVAILTCRRQNDLIFVAFQNVVGSARIMSLGQFEFLHFALSFCGRPS
jgi:hypothetical protein